MRARTAAAERALLRQWNASEPIRARDAEPQWEQRHIEDDIEAVEDGRAREGLKDAPRGYSPAVRQGGRRDRP